MKLKFLILVLALQSAWLLGTVFIQEHALQVGAVVRLETRPVDPRDLLRGDYVILNYKISSIPTNRFTPALPPTLPLDRTIWVSLAPRGEFHEIVRASTERFAPDSGEVLMKGKANRWDGGRNAAREVRVDYGLEHYYVREGTGNPRGKLTVQAVVPVSGQARIKQVLLDGKPYAEAMKETAH